MDVVQVVVALKVQNVLALIVSVVKGANVARKHANVHLIVLVVQMEDANALVKITVDVRKDANAVRRSTNHVVIAKDAVKLPFN